jgi:predicted nucleic acid-binding protein
MSVEFVDTNVLVYAHDGGAGAKHTKAADLLTRLFEEEIGALSVQVLSEFYAVATRKLGRTSQEAEDIVSDFGSWAVHRSGHSDLLKAAQLQRRYQLSWWDALVLNSALELG